MIEALEQAKIAAAAAADKKGIRPILMDLKGQSDLCDYQFIVSGENDRQTRAIAKAIETDLVQKMGVKPYAVEGKVNGHWIMMDYGSLNIHIFYDYIRDFYALEQLWPQSIILDIPK